MDQNIVGSDMSVRNVVNQNHYNYKNWTENVVVHYILVNQNVVKLQLVVMVNTLYVEQESNWNFNSFI